MMRSEITRSGPKTSALPSASSALSTSRNSYAGPSIVWMTRRYAAESSAIRILGRGSVMRRSLGSEADYSVTCPVHPLHELDELRILAAGVHRRLHLRRGRHELRHLVAGRT